MTDLLEFQRVFLEWFENYYSEDHCSDEFYCQKAREYAGKMARAVGGEPGEEQQLFNALIDLSKNDYTTSVILDSQLTDNDLIIDPEGARRAVHQLLYESHFSPLLNVEEKSIPGNNYTYIVSHNNIEICRIGVEYEERAVRMRTMGTWRTQIIHTDGQREKILQLWGKILAGVCQIPPAIRTPQTPTPGLAGGNHKWTEDEETEAREKYNKATILIEQGQTVDRASQLAGISKATFYNYKNRFG